MKNQLRSVFCYETAFFRNPKNYPGMQLTSEANLGRRSCRYTVSIIINLVYLGKRGRNEPNALVKGKDEQHCG